MKKINKYQCIENELKKDVTISNITIKSSIIDYAIEKKWEKKFEDLKKIKEKTPDWSTSLKIWINELKFIVKETTTNSNYDYESKNILVAIIYNDIMLGNINSISYYIDYLVNEKKDHSNNITYEYQKDKLNCIIDGVLIAFSLNRLEKEYLNLSNNNIKKDVINVKNSNNAIIWNKNNVLLIFLIDWLKENHYISDKSSRNSIIKNHFTNISGEEIKNIRQSLHNVKALNEGQLPKGYEKLENLFKELEMLEEFIKKL